MGYLPPMPQLIAVSRKTTDLPEEFPFTVPSVRSIQSMDLEVPVALFVGENGSGKSTLLESLAVAAELPAVGSGRLARDPPLEAQRTLAKYLRLAWKRRTHRGFFLRAEDFFGFQKDVAKRRIDSSGPSSANGGIMAFTRLPSGSLASTIGLVSSTRLPTRLTMR